MLFITRRLFWVGVAVCIAAAFTAAAGAGFEDLRHGLRYGGLLSLTGVTLMFVGRWDATPRVPFERPYQNKLRRVVLCGMFVVPGAIFAWGLGFGTLAFWVLAPFCILAAIYNLWVLREHNKAREREYARYEERINRVSGGGTRSAGLRPDRSDVPGSPTYKPPQAPKKE